MTIFVSETEVMELFDKANNILLVEPPYPKKYPPLGLAKIKTYLLNRGKTVTFAEYIPPEKFDLICVTTLFTYYSKFVYKILRNRGFFNHDTPILLGGVLASIMPQAFENEDNTFLFKGYSKILDTCIPDKELMDNIEEPWNEFSYVFTSRGCPNKCAYCTVWRIEKERWVNPTWKDYVDLDKPNLMISDNNLSASTFEHIKGITDFALKHKKKILFDNGFDCKYITEEMAIELAKLKFIRNGMRMAFDRIEEDGIFQKAVNILQSAGVSASDMMAYVLFNFMDKPQDAYYRARTCADLKVRPYPQYYRPLNILDKNVIWVGKHWTLQLGRAFRHYWLMRGIYSKISFEKYIKSEIGISRHRLTEKDISMYMNNGILKGEKKNERDKKSKKKRIFKSSGKRQGRDRIKKYN